ncbi:hypothetical protein IU453_27715 [Nocardia cyriacigeorgica]|uniref:YobI family P-loop NTPase n=1 Tax=Nocardia cyriacigeorgica TaxID=135487 RepID=UPI001894AD2B|nr:hypothetical protein [Nocardia cyriacigeorgica]MBF6320536.1 hypothetical protein [Nocardia cyriacigeorgica]MBF6535023.1 hypothetical protein [Nocardia cyriacigeorgica]
MRTLLRFRDRRAASGAATDGRLLPLTSAYRPAQHEVYVQHLDAALSEPSLHNIALTGRYGVGKSSVLDQTELRHRRRVLRVSLSNLGAAEEDETLTNRIEKEFVKQLLHREPPRRVPQSRFRRISTRSFGTSFVVTLFQVAVVGGVLWLLGGSIALKPIQGDHRWWVQALGWAGLIFGVVAVLTWLRSVTRDHVVSQFSAAGASVTLTKSDSTYFDEFLDEIVYFFARVKVDIVILEDLDRYNDPHIFQALRELNTVLNSSKQIRRRRIRFIYAIRDSVFERLGQNPDGAQHAGEASGADADAADAELELANRTKFFDIVIPMVPFITHNNARDLLERLMKDEPEPVRVSGELMDLVARKLPDMRLLTNIRNEYSVFANRLITNNHGVEDLSPDKLFAMVVYKNVHLRDFEQILLGKGNLDTLDKVRRELVRDSIASCEERVREINNGLAARAALQARLSSLREKLEWLVESMKRANPQQESHGGYLIDGVHYPVEQAETVEFWERLFSTSHPWSIIFTQYSNSRHVQMHRSDLHRLIGGELELDAWTARTSAELDQEEAGLEAKLARLRHADFLTLLDLPEFTSDYAGTSYSFSAVVSELVGSALAAELITHGYIDPYYGVYVSQYYGGRVSARAMKFLMKNVGTNTAEIHGALTPADIDAVLRETSGSFLNDLSGYNIDILDHLLANTTTLDSGPLASRPLADVLLGHVINRLGDLEREFLNSYLLGGRETNAVVGWLARHWTEVFTFLVDNAHLDIDTQVRFVDTALLNVDARLPYVLDADVQAFLNAHYTEMDAITGNHSDADTDAAASLLDKAGFVCEELAPVGARMRVRLVAADRYSLTAANLKAAAGAATIELDTLLACNADVYADAIAHPRRYLAAFDTDAGTEFTISDPGEFTNILSDLAPTPNEDDDNTSGAAWPAQDIDKVVASAAPDCRVTTLTEHVAVPIWPVLARMCRFDASLTNVYAYVSAVGSVDADLAGLLIKAGAIDCTAGSPQRADAGEVDIEEPSEVAVMKMHVAIAVLTASTTLPDAEFRTRLVESMNLTEWVLATDLTPERGPMLALLIARNICADTAATFSHFPCEDWDTLRPAIIASDDIAEFADPSFIDETAIERIFASTGSDISDSVCDKFLDSLAAFTPDGSPAALLAAGRYAIHKKHHLERSVIERIAAATRDPSVTVGLLALLGEAEVTGIEIERILIQLPGEYPLLNQTGKKFDLPNDPAHRKLMSRLQRDGHIASFRQRRTARDKLAVTTKN